MSRPLISFYVEIHDQEELKSIFDFFRTMSSKTIKIDGIKKVYEIMIVTELDRELFHDHGFGVGKVFITDRYDYRTLPGTIKVLYKKLENEVGVSIDLFFDQLKEILETDVLKQRYTTQEFDFVCSRFERRDNYTIVEVDPNIPVYQETLPGLERSGESYENYNYPTTPAV
jgi:hypothetical protein